MAEEETACNDKPHDQGSRISKTALAIISAIIIAACSGIIGYYQGVSTQISIDDHRNKQMVYSKLMGHKMIINQFYDSLMLANLHIDYHLYLWRLNGSQEGTINQKELVRYMNQAAELSIHLAREKQLLFETIGMVNTIFKRTEKLSELSRYIYDMRSIETPYFKEGITKEELKNRLWEKYNKAKIFSASYVKKLIDPMANYIETQLE